MDAYSIITPKTDSHFMFMLFYKLTSKLPGFFILRSFKIDKPSTYYQIKKIIFKLQNPRKWDVTIVSKGERVEKGARSHLKVCDFITCPLNSRF